jgi:DNA-binding NtrC family response regulator
MSTVYDVIFIDDESSLTDIFQQYVIWKYKDWNFLTFNNSLTAYNAIVGNRVSARVWIIDMMMPQKNGADIAEAIRAQSGGQPILLAYTALDRRALESNDAYRSGMSHFNHIINKREDFSSILSLVEVWVKDPDQAVL